MTAHITLAGLQRMSKGRGHLRQMAVGPVNKIIVNKTDRKDPLGKLLEELEVGTDSKGMSFDLVDVQTEALGFIIAGSHTTAATSTLLLWHLLHNPFSTAEIRRGDRHPAKAGLAELSEHSHQRPHLSSGCLGWKLHHQTRVRHAFSSHRAGGRQAYCRVFRTCRH